jgi:hypothetical protein
MMNERIKELAEQAGFVFWDNEDWKPTNSGIDWACNYDDQMELFVKLLIIDVFQTQEHLMHDGVSVDNWYNAIKTRYGIG